MGIFKKADYILFIYIVRFKNWSWDDCSFKQKKEKLFQKHLFLLYIHFPLFCFPNAYLNTFCRGKHFGKN